MKLDHCNQKMILFYYLFILSAFFLTFYPIFLVASIVSPSGPPGARDPTLNTTGLDSPDEGSLC